MDAVLHYLVALGLGAGAGLIGGILGISGGTISIAALSLTGHTQQMAQGTTLVMQLPNLALGAWQYTRRGKLDVRSALVLSASAMPFTFLGALVATHMPSNELRLIFGSFFLVLATFTLWNALRSYERITSAPMRWYYLLGLGAVAGFATGIFGIGGPALATPCLVLFFGVLQTVAQGMALFLAVPGTVISLITYARAGDVDWGEGIALAIGGAVLVAQGVAIAHRMREKSLRLLFSGFLYLIAALLLTEAMR